MYSKTELESMAHFDLIGIAKQMGISRADRKEKQDLVYSILDHQAVNPADSADHRADDGDRQDGNSRRRQHMKPQLLAESSMRNPDVHRRNNRKKGQQHTQAYAGKGEIPHPIPPSFAALFFLPNIA